MTPLTNSTARVTRRHFLRDCGVGLGKIALAALLTDACAVAGRRRAAQSAHADARRIFRPRRRRVIHLFMAGAPSQLELFDYKPELTKLEGKPLPPSVIGGQRYAFIRPDAAVLGPRFKFAQARPVRRGAFGDAAAPREGRGRHLPSSKSCKTDQFNHAPAQIFFNTGFSQPGRPSLGSWVALRPRRGDAEPAGVRGDEHRQRHQRRLGAAGRAASCRRVYTGARFRNQGDPILNVSQPDGRRREAPARHARSGQRAEPPAARGATAIRRSRRASRPTRWPSACKPSAPELMDLQERKQGDARALRLRSGQAVVRPRLPARAADDRARRALRQHLPRRLGRPLRRGRQREEATARRPTRPAPRSVTDLKRARPARRHAGDLGRRIRPHADGRDERRARPQRWAAITIRRRSRCGWPAAASRPASRYGATDDLGFHVVENPVHVHDLQATILHLLGFDHERLTFRSAGRDFRLTDVEPCKVVKEIIA